MQQLLTPITSENFNKYKIKYHPKIASCKSGYELQQREGVWVQQTSRSFSDFQTTRGVENMRRSRVFFNELTSRCFEIGGSPL